MEALVVGKSSQWCSMENGGFPNIFQHAMFDEPYTMVGPYINLDQFSLPALKSRHHDVNEESISIPTYSYLWLVSYGNLSIISIQNGHRLFPLFQKLRHPKKYDDQWIWMRDVSRIGMIPKIAWSWRAWRAETPPNWSGIQEQIGAELFL